MPSREDELGGLWTRQGRNGEFLSGKLTIDGREVEVIVFPNDRKQPGEKTPDWRVYRSQPRDGGGQQTYTRGELPAPQQNYQPRPNPSHDYRGQGNARPQRPLVPTDLDDEVPF